MRAWDARRARIEIEAGVEGRLLIGAAMLDDPVAAADRPHPSTDAVAGFKDGHLVTGFLELVGRDQPGNSGAEDDDRSPLPAPRRNLEILGSRRRWDREAEGLHREVHRAGPADGPNMLEQSPTRECHIPPLSSPATRPAGAAD